MNKEKNNAKKTEPGDLVFTTRGWFVLSDITHYTDGSKRYHLRGENELDDIDVFDAAFAEIYKTHIPSRNGRAFVSLLNAVGNLMEFPS